MQANEYQGLAAVTAIYPGQGEVEGLTYTALGLAGEAGEVANKVKKVLRDDDGVLTEEKRHQIKQELGGVMWYIANVCSELGISLDEVLQWNLDELASRAERGTLKGSGDNR